MFSLTADGGKIVLNIILFCISLAVCRPLDLPLVVNKAYLQHIK